MSELPDAELSVVVGKNAYRLRKPDAGGALVAEFRPSVTVALTSPAMFKEAISKLARPLEKAIMTARQVAGGDLRGARQTLDQLVALLGISGQERSSDIGRYLAMQKAEPQ